MGRAFGRLGDLVSERQHEGANYLYRGVPRSFKLLLLAFIITYLAYWTGSLLSAPAQLTSALFMIMGFLMAIALAITTVKFWPRLEHALPRWFRADVEAPELQPYLKYLAWLGMALLIIVAGLFTHQLVLAVVVFMGIAGGAFVLFIAEAYWLELLEKLKRRHPKRWMEGARFSFLLLLAGFFVALIALILFGTYVVEGQGPIRDVYYLFLALLTSFVMVVQILVLAVFLVVMTYRSWMRWRLSKGRTYGGLRTALLKVKPLYLVLYLELMNLTTGVYVALYLFMVAVQSATVVAGAGSESPFTSLAMMDSWLLDYVALGSIIISWVVILINLSGSAVRSRKWYINRNIFASATVVIAMALLLQVITNQGDEVLVSLIFRIFYMAGVMLAPLLVFWRRWKIQGQLYAGSGAGSPSEGPVT